MDCDNKTPWRKPYFSHHMEYTHAPTTTTSYATRKTAGVHCFNASMLKFLHIYMQIMHGSGSSVVPLDNDINDDGSSPPPLLASSNTPSRSCGYLTYRDLFLARFPFLFTVVKIDPSESASAYYCLRLGTINIACGRTFILVVSD